MNDEPKLSRAQLISQINFVTNEANHREKYFNDERAKYRDTIDKLNKDVSNLIERDAMRERIAHLEGQLAMLTRLGTIPAAVDPGVDVWRNPNDNSLRANGPFGPIIK